MNTGFRILSIVMVVIVSFGSFAHLIQAEESEEKAVEKQEKSDEAISEDKIIRLIGQLDDDSFKVRRIAEQLLLKMGRSIYKQLEKSKKEASLETSVSIERILQEIKNNLYTDHSVEYEQFKKADLVLLGKLLPSKNESPKLRFSIIELFKKDVDEIEGKSIQVQYNKPLTLPQTEVILYLKKKVTSGKCGKSLRKIVWHFLDEDAKKGIGNVQSNPKEFSEAMVVLRVKHLRNLPGLKIHHQELQVLKVMKNTTDKPIETGKNIIVHFTCWSKGVPQEECTVYLFKENGYLWLLDKGKERSISHIRIRKQMLSKSLE